MENKMVDPMAGKRGGEGRSRMIGGSSYHGIIATIGSSNKCSLLLPSFLLISSSSSSLHSLHSLDFALWLWSAPDDNRLNEQTATASSAPTPQSLPSAASRPPIPIAWRVAEHRECKRIQSSASFTSGRWTDRQYMSWSGAACGKIPQEKKRKNPIISCRSFHYLHT